MKLYAKIAMISCAASLALVACSKNNPPETNPQPEAAPAAVAPAPEAAPAAPAVNEDSLAAERARLEAERLEAERARLEALINQIMSEDVYFDFDRSELTEKAKELLAQVGELLLKETRFTVTIEGPRCEARHEGEGIPERLRHRRQAHGIRQLRQGSSEGSGRDRRGLLPEPPRELPREYPAVI